MEHGTNGNKSESIVMRRGGDTLGRAWCFTAFDEGVIGRIRTMPDILALVVGEEICPSTGRTHYQSYVRFQDNKRFSWWRNQFPAVHVEKRSGTEHQAAEYCRKEGRVLVDFGCAGKLVRTGNARVDVRRMIESGAPAWQIYRHNPDFYFWNRSKIRDLIEDVKLWKENGNNYLPDSEED